MRLRSYGRRWRKRHWNYAFERGTHGLSRNTRDFLSVLFRDIQYVLCLTIAATDEASGKAALDEVTRLTGSVEVGKIYEGQITSIKEFGLFVEVLAGRDGMCHVSELADEYADAAYVRANFKVGDVIPVKAIAVEYQNRIKLSRKAALRDLQRGDDI